MYRFHTGFLHHFIRAIGIKRRNFHSESFCDTGYITSYLSESMNAQFLPLELCARCTVIHVAHGHHGKPENKFGYRI